MDPIFLVHVHYYSMDVVCCVDQKSIKYMQDVGESLQTITDVIPRRGGRDSSIDPWREAAASQV